MKSDEKARLMRINISRGRHERENRPARLGLCVPRSITRWDNYVGNMYIDSAVVRFPAARGSARIVFPAFSR